MNWMTKGEDKLENLPKWERPFPPDDGTDRWRGEDLPYTKIKRWIEGQEGIHIDSVVHKFVNLKWVPRKYRTIAQISNFIERDTCIEGNKIYYFISWGDVRYRPVEKEMKKLVYVHPKTGLVCVFRPMTRISWQKKAQEEQDKRVRIIGDYHQLYKQNGIWFEVRGEPIEVCEPCYLNFDRKGPRDILLEPTNCYNRKSSKPIVKITLKRQLSSKELRKYVLKND